MSLAVIKFFSLLCLSLPVFGGFTAPPPVYKTTAECIQHENLMGSTDHEVIVICPDNINNKGEDENTVLKHEIVHIIHHNFGMTDDETILPEPYFTNLIRAHVPSGEVLSVFMNESYDSYVNQELEARLLSKLPKHVIMSLYWISTEYASFTSSNI